MALLEWDEWQENGMSKFTYDDEPRGLHIAVLSTPREHAAYFWVTTIDGRPVAQGTAAELAEARGAALAAAGVAVGATL